MCCVLNRVGYSANSFANYSIVNAVAKLSEGLPAVVAKSLDEWLERTRGKVTPHCFPFLHREAWIYAFEKYNTVSSSAAVERVFAVGSDILRPKRASPTAENLERFVLLLRENEKMSPPVFVPSEIK